MELPPRTSIVGAVIAEARSGRGAVAAVPLSDTLKSATRGPGPIHILGTVPREGLWRAQTPQGFPRTMLAAALAAARREGPEPAAALGRV